MSQHADVSSCGKIYASFYKDCNGVRRYVAFPLRCHSWQCPYCRKVKAENYIKRMSQLFDGRQLYFLTLTYFHSVSPLEAWKNYNKAWNHFRTTINRKYRSFSYCRVLESHKNSPYPHLHIIMDVDIPTAELGKISLRCGFGYQVNIKQITSDGAKYYITKYVTKEWTNEEAAKLRKETKARIITFSKDICTPEKKDGGWIKIATSYCLNDSIEDINIHKSFTLPKSFIKTSDALSTYDYSCTYSSSGEHNCLVNTT
jgi:hypothetical protein